MQFLAVAAGTATHFSLSPVWFAPSPPPLHRAYNHYPACWCKQGD